MKARRYPRHAFTLLELLIVVGLIAALSTIVFGVLGTTRGAALQSGQSLVANLLVAARTRAAASGRPARLLIHADASSATAATRFLRSIVLQMQVNGAWQSVTEARLPDGVYVVPGNFALPAGLFGNAEPAWTRTDGAALRSTALRAANLVSETVDGEGVERWASLPFAAAGTTGASGDLVLALGRGRAPGTFAAGESPVELTDVEQVRGLTVNVYGVATLIDRRANF